MLVLSRKKNESIVIDDKVTVMVVEIRTDKVRLGVEAPKEIPVHRKEVYDIIHKEKAAAGTLEDRTKETLSNSFQEDHYEQFKKYMTEKKFAEAAKIYEYAIADNLWKPNYQELSELSIGLRGLIK